MRLGHALLALWLIGCGVSFAASPAKSPSGGEFHITTQPAGAALTVDGVKRGVAPVTLSGLPAGDHLVVAALAGHEDARKTVILIAENPRTEVDLRLEPIAGLVLIHTEPAGAEVKVDGADRGRTPLFLSDILLGKHRVQLALQGHQPKEIDLTIRDRTPQKIAVSMTSDSAKIILDSTPTGAAVTLNGIDKGKTPCALDRIPAGDSKLEVALQGFETYTQTLKLAAGQEEKLTALLKPVPATLMVVSIPDKARIYVNDQFRGAAPLTLKDVAPGSLRVRAELRGYEADARTIELKQAQQLTEEFRLTKNGGALEIVTEPAGVKVFIDGEEVGTTIAKVSEADTVSEPLQIDLLTAGPHEVQLTRKGYFNKALDIVIEKDKTEALHEILNRRFIPDYEVGTPSEIVRGVLIEKDPLGNIKMEVKPGVFKTIPAKDVRTCVPLKEKPEVKETGPSDTK